MSKKINELVQKRTDLEAQLIAIETQLVEEEARAKSWVSADEARRLLSLFSDPWGKAELDKYENVTRTLVALRAKPSNMTDKFLTWATQKDEDSMFPADQFSVSLEARNNEVYLNDDYEQVAHTLSIEEAELLGRRLLGAAEAGRRIEEQEEL